MARGAWIVLVVAGTGLAAAYILSRRRLRVVPAVTEPLSPDRQRRAQEAASREAVRLDEPLGTLAGVVVSTFEGDALRERAILTVVGREIRLEGPASRRLVLGPSTDVELVLDIANGGAREAVVVVDAQLLRTDGSRLARFWVGDNPTPEVRIPAHSLAKLRLVTVRPASLLASGIELALVVALSTSGGKTLRYDSSGPLFRVAR